MIKKENITRTTTYKNATKAQRMLLTGRTQKHHIRRSIKKIKSIGVRKWLEITQASAISQEIILELYSLKLKVNV